MHFFSKEYQQKLFRYRRWQDAQLSLLGRLLVKKGLNYFGEEADLKKLQFTKYNKPYLEDTNVEFNVSHTGELVVALLSNQKSTVGVDIEKIHSIEIEDFKKQMTPYEQNNVFQSDDNLNKFFTYWTQKEAVIKAHGNGLSIPLKSFEIRNNETCIDEQTFYLTEVPIEEGYVCHFASYEKTNAEKIIVKKIDINTFIKL